MANSAWTFCVSCLFMNILVGVLGGLELSCYQCVSYLEGRPNDLCPFNASVDATRAGQGHCAGKCFTHNSVDSGGVEVLSRGCSSSQWGLPDPLPEDGCYSWKSQTWCLCSHNGCNGVPLGPSSNTSMDYLKHINETDETNNSTSFLPPNLEQDLPGLTLCWECSSDVNGQHYDYCPFSGRVDVTRAYIGNCTGRCFMYNITVQPGNIQAITRGCTATQWLPNPLPADGWYTWKSQVWYICSQHGCNGARMSIGTGNFPALDSHLHKSVNVAGHIAVGRWQYIISIWMWTILFHVNFGSPTY